MIQRLLMPAAFAMTAAVGIAAPASAALTGATWHFDEPAGATTAVDGSGAGHDGTVHGSVTTGEPGYQGSAYAFDGGWVEVPSADDLNPGTGDFSYSAYVKPSRHPGTDETFDVLRKGLAGRPGGEFKMEIASHGRVKCVAQGIMPDGTRVTATVVTGWTNLADGDWHRLECSRTGSTWTVSRDGVTKSITKDFGALTSPRSVVMGSKYGNDDFMRGLIDEAQLQIVTP